MKPDLHRSDERFVRIVARPNSLDLEKLDQHFAHPRPQAIEHPLVVEKPLPGEEALAITLAFKT